MATMHPYEVDAELRNVHMSSKELADKVGLKKLIELETGYSFSTYLTDRRAADVMQTAVQNWLEKNCRQFIDAFPYVEASRWPNRRISRDLLISDTAAYLYWDLVCEEYGRDRAIALRNHVFGNKDIRDEFLARGAAASRRDFSYLLSLVQ